MGRHVGPMLIDVAPMLADTIHLNAKEMGVLIRLMVLAWRAPKRLLPGGDRLLAQVAGIGPAAWQHMKHRVLHGWIPVGDAWRINPHFLAPTSRPALPQAVRAQVIAQGSCTYCGTTEGPFEIDHVLAHSLGGSDEPENLTLACQGCNRSKGAQDLQAWLAQRGLPDTAPGGRAP